MKMHEIINEGIRPPVSCEQVVTSEWIQEVLDNGFDTGIPHAGAAHQSSGFDVDSMSRMLDDLQEEGFIPNNVDLDDSNSVFPYIQKWLKLRFRYVVRNMEVSRVKNGYRIGREIRLSQDAAKALSVNTAALGNFWSFKDGEAYWGDDEIGSVFLTAIVGRNDIDWITTIRRNMNYTLGEDEQEAFIASGTPIRLMSMKMEDGNGGWIALPISNPNRRA